MTTAGKFVPGERAAYLRTIAPRDLPVEKQLCELLEATLPTKGLKLYAGFPVVVRNSEWLVGFAERGKHPVVYCCSSVVLQAMGKGLALMTGKACLTLRAREGITVEQALTLVARALLLAKKHGGMISQAAAKQRDRVRNGNNARTAPKKVSSKSADLCTTKPMPAGFACQLERPSLVILLGDHQPPIAAAMDPPDHTKDVPIHVFANRPELLTPLRELGFVDGFSVPDSMTAFSTVEIAPMLLRALGR